MPQQETPAIHSAHSAVEQTTLALDDRALSWLKRASKKQRRTHNNNATLLRGPTNYLRRRTSDYVYGKHNTEHTRSRAQLRAVYRHARHRARRAAQRLPHRRMDRRARRCCHRSSAQRRDRA